MLMFKQTSTGREKDIVYLRISSLQCELSSAADSSFMPESRSLFPLKSSSLRWDVLDLRAETREAQLISDNLHKLSLKKEYSKYH